MKVKVTVKARIFVRVTPGGNWLALGDPQIDDDLIQEELIFGKGVDAGYWIEVELPIPTKNKKEEFPVSVTRA